MLKDTDIPTRLLHEPPRPIAIYVPVAAWRFWLVQFLPRFLFVLVLLVSRRLTERPSRDFVALQLRALFESLSGLWIKAGQILALRRDLIPKEYADELANLQFRTAGFSPDEAIEIIERELGRPLDEMFSEFNREPLGAASLAQTHFARLKGTSIPVAVKVLRPTVERELDLSFRRIRFVVRLFDRFDVKPYFRWNELLLELKQTLDEELDYRIEAASLRIFRKHLKRDRIYVPKVFRRLSSRRVLTMEFVEGVFMAEYIRAREEEPARVARWQAENNVRPEKVARLLYVSYLRQLFEDNLFHADLHPGNIILLRDSRVALIDFGSVGFLEGEFLLLYQYFLEAITDRKYGKAVDLIFLISNALPTVDLSEAKNALVLAFRAWETRSRTEDLPYDEKSLVNAIRDMFVFLMQKRITLASSFLRVFRCELTLDTSLKYLGPALDYMTITRRYFRRMRGREFERLTEPRALLDHIGRVSVDLIGASRDFGEDSLHFSTRLRRSVQEFSATTSKAAELWRSALNLLGLGIGLAAVYLATVFLQIVMGVRIYDTLPSWVGYLPGAGSNWIWLALGVGVAAVFRTVRRMARQLGVPENMSVRDRRGLL